MTPERWQQIKNLVNSAVAEDDATRSALLQQSCADDLPLRRGAEALLSFHHEATKRLANAPAAVAQLDSSAPMTAERWQQIEQLFQAAMEQEPAQRAAYLAKVCGGDEALRQEVEALLVFQTGVSGMLQGVIHEAAGLLADTNGEKARFKSGMTLNKRYRIIGLLGKGGMGEVYRADDLKLGHPVALKFLTEKLSQDKAMLARFHGEVAMAHRVTHPNVCRVHDIGDVTTSSGKLHFLSMEYVDGEDLSSLLRRIGRLPADKAVEIANQLCAGLAAAHEAGVLHRDLKPANVMLDGKGRVRITDFGLAGFAEQIRGSEVMAGTPAYMSPEQFAGKEVTTKSDIYALGLVLYEIFTGKRVFEANSLQELQRLHESSSPTNPSNWVKDIDPLVERVILRCLEKEPAKRLASAKQVADALPGGDPLVAALAMGDTPSPEMVAASGEKTGMRPRIAVACLVAIIAGLIIAAFLGNKTSFVTQALRENSPDALEYKAREIIQRLGYTARPIDHASRLVYVSDYIRYVEQTTEPAKRWDRFTRGQPSAIEFWYRESPRYLPAIWTGIEGRIWEDLPPQNISGMVNIRLDPQGRLVMFNAVPPQRDQSRGLPPPPDWAALFTAAGLDVARFEPAEAQWTPLLAYDARAAWTGTYPNLPEISLRIEAAAYRGKPVYFQLIWPWTRPWRMQEFQMTTGRRLSFILTESLLLLLLLGAALLARYNFRQGRGDRPGAFRLATIIYAALMLRWLFGAHHVPTSDEITALIFIANGEALVAAGMVWLLYIALEPYARRRWPVTLISWNRLLSGGLRDPLVGRDLLIGVIFGVCMGLVSLLDLLITTQLGTRSVNIGWLDHLLGARYLIANDFLRNLHGSLNLALLLFFLLLLLRVLTRRQWLATSILVLILVMLSALNSSAPLIAALTFSLYWLLMIAALLRSGLLALATGGFISELIGNLTTTDFTAWHASVSLSLLLAALALAVYAFHTSLGGQKVFAGKLLEE